MTTDIESRLAAALAEQARTEVPDASPVPPFSLPARAPWREHRRVWLASGMLAAACLVAVALAVWITGVTDVARPAPVATHPPTPSVSVAVTPPVTPSAPATDATSPAGATPTHVVSVAGVLRLTVPATWDLAPSVPTAPGDVEACLTIGGVARSTGVVDNCQLRVLQHHDAAPLATATDPDAPGVFDQGSLCGTGGAGSAQTMTDAQDAQVGGRAADYRAWTGNCFAGSYEQWAVLTSDVVVTRAVSDAALTEAAARTALTGVEWIAGSTTLRSADKGIARSMSGNVLRLDRVIVRNGALQNTNPATYAYPVSGAATGRYVDSVGGSTVPLTVADLRTLASGGTVAGVPPASSLLLTLATDGSQVVDYLLTAQP